MNTLWNCRATCGKTPAFERLSGRMVFRAILLTILLLEWFLGSGWDYRTRTCCIITL
jgi:hypothetical protein